MLLDLVLKSHFTFLAQVGGLYFDDCNEKQPDPYCLKPDVQSKLWTLSEQWTGLAKSSTSTSSESAAAASSSSSTTTSKVLAPPHQNRDLPIEDEKKHLDFPEVGDSKQDLTLPKAEEGFPKQDLNVPNGNHAITRKSTPASRPREKQKRLPKKTNNNNPQTTSSGRS